MENPIKIDDLGVPPFKETPMEDHWTIFVGTQKQKIRSIFEAILRKRDATTGRL